MNPKVKMKYIDKNKQEKVIWMRLSVPTRPTQRISGLVLLGLVGIYLVRSGWFFIQSTQVGLVKSSRIGFFWLCISKPIYDAWFGSSQFGSSRVQVGSFQWSGLRGILCHSNPIHQVGFNSVTFGSCRFGSAGISSDIQP